MANKNESFISVLKRNLNGLCELVNEQLFEGCREWYWVGDHHGGICCFDDTDYLNVEDMILILEQDVTYDQYAEWHNAELDHPYQHINLRSWLMGARHEMLRNENDDENDD